MPFTIKVVESDEVEAWALPGGYLYVNSGLILAADSEVELAGLMAHQIAHVAVRHVTRTETRMKILNALSIASIYFGGAAGGALQMAVSIAAPALFMKFGRDAEREAERPDAPQTELSVGSRSNRASFRYEAKLQQEAQYRPITVNS